MASLGIISAAIGLDTSGLEQGQKNAEKSLGDLGKQMRSGINTAGKYGAALGAAGAALATKFVKDAMDAIDAQAKLARQVGSTTESIAVLDRAAELAGIEQNEMRKNVEKLNQRLGEAREGTGAAAEQFDKLGLSADEMSKLPIDQRFEAIGARMEELNWSTDQQANAWRDLGIRGTGIINMLEDNQAALKQAREETARFGTAVSDVDAAQIEAANDAMSAIGRVLEGVVNRAAVKVAPIMQAISETITDAAVEGEGLGSILDKVFDGMISGAKLAGDSFRGIQIILKTLEVAAQGLGTAMTSTLTLVLEGLSQLVAGAMDGLSALIQTVNRIPGINIPTEGLDSFRENVGATIETMQGMRESAHTALAETTNELHELAMTPLPLQAFDNYLQEATTKSRQAVEEVVKSRRERNEMIANLDDEEATRTDEFNEEALERLREQLKTEQELAEESHAQRLETLDDALKNEAVTQDEYAQLKEKLEQEHMDNMAKIRGEGMREMEDVSRTSLQAQTQDMQGAFNDMFGAFTQHSESMNKANKTFGQAQAFISTVTGAAEALKLGWPQGPIAAASIMQQGMGLVSQIKSASTRGGSGGSSTASSGHRQSPMAVGQQNEQRSGSLDLDVMGGRTSDREFARRILNEANDLMGDGFELRVRGGG